MIFFCIINCPYFSTNFTGKVLDKGLDDVYSNNTVHFSLY